MFMPIGLWGYQRSGLVTYKETIAYYEDFIYPIYVGCKIVYRKHCLQYSPILSANLVDIRNVSDQPAFVDSPSSFDIRCEPDSAVAPGPSQRTIDG